ncbi:MAG TPA: hypothetical protein PL033_05390 [Candidatus Brocadiia bacterium]|nr:hypothetical protein [Candidatus Brocadiia bacterium]
MNLRIIGTSSLQEYLPGLATGARRAHFQETISHREKAALSNGRRQLSKGFFIAAPRNCVQDVTAIDRNALSVSHAGYDETNCRIFQKDIIGAQGGSRAIWTIRFFSLKDADRAALRGRERET